MQDQRRVAFTLGSANLQQTSEAIASLISNDQDDLLLAAYGYAHAGALNDMHLGSWLLKNPQKRRLIILVGVHDDDRKQNPPYRQILTNFNDLFSHWAAHGVPLDRVLVYAVEHWHSKLLASMQSIGSLPATNFSGGVPQDFEKAFSYDKNQAVAGQVREAIIGSSNATYRALGAASPSYPLVRNFELDVHVLRTKSVELGDLSSKVHSILATAIELVNTSGSVSQIVTNQLRALLPVAGVVPPYKNITYGLTGI